jgi:hypothetical protein
LWIGEPSMRRFLFIGCHTTFHLLHGADSFFWITYGGRHMPDTSSEEGYECLIGFKKDMSDCMGSSMMALLSGKKGWNCVVES